MEEKKVSKNIVISSLIWKFLERGGVQGVQFILSIVLARLISPEDYGVIALILVFIQIATVFIQSGFNTALIQKNESDDTDFSSNNLGIILGDSIDMLDIQLAPMFDLEYSFQGMKNYNNDDWVNRIPNDWLSDLPRLKKDLTVVAKKYRHFLDKAIKSLDVDNIADKIREIVSPYDSQPDRYVKFICGRINTIKQIYKEVCNNIDYYSDMDMSI